MGYDQLYKDYQEAQRDYNRAVRYTEWLERRMLEAPDEQTFNEYADKLEEQEQLNAQKHVRAKTAELAFMSAAAGHDQRSNPPR